MATGRRFLGGQIRLAQRSWADVAPELEFFLARLWDSEANGIPAGFNNIDPEDIQAGVAADPGEESSGWAAANHQHAVLTDIPVPVGFVLDAGTSSALSRADHVHTIAQEVLDEILAFAFLGYR